jgi:hypothetical protein
MAIREQVKDTQAQFQNSSEYNYNLELKSIQPIV